MRQVVLLMGALGPLCWFGCAPLVNVMTFFPERTERRVHEPLPGSVSEVFVTTADGESLQCFLARGTTDSNVVLYFHGNAGNIYQRVPELVRIAQCGPSVLGVGFRGYGKSTGRPSERGICRDGAAALTYATAVLGYAETQVVVMGRSLGTVVAARTAAGRDVGGLVLVTPLTTGRAYARAHGLGMIAFLAGSAFDNLGAARTVRCRTLIVHGSNDEVIPFWMGRELYESLGAPKEFVEIPGGFHNTLEYDSPELFWGTLERFLGGAAADATPAVPGSSR